MNNVRKCKNPTCDRPVLGRSDKVYCTDGCRSSHYNDTKKEKEPDPYTIIPKFQKNNREILKRIYDNNGGYTKVSKNYLIRLGYNFTYHTHFMLDYNHKFHECCYDYAFRMIDNYWIEISKSNDDEPKRSFI